MQELTIRDILRIVRKWLLLILVIPLVLAIAASIYYYSFVPDTYEARTTLYVLRTYETTASSTSSGYDWSTSAQLVADYQVLIQQEPVMNRAIKLLGGGDDLGATIKVTSGASTSAGSNSRFMYITAAGTDPAQCARAANAITEAFISYLDESGLLEAPINIITEAKVPEFPSGPQRVQSILTATLIGLVVAVGIAFAIELLNNTIRSESDAVNAFDMPVLSNVISYNTEMDNYYREAGRRTRELYRAVSGLTQESIKTLAANIQFCSMDKPIKTLMLTSTIPKEGKSSVAVMLASAMADDGKRVLIVDIDFRSPTIGRLFFTRNRWDLVDYVSKRQSLENIISQVPNTGVYFIDSMHKASIATSLLKMDAFDEFIQLAGQAFDMVIFDTSPLGMYIDAAILSSKVDACLFVIGSGLVDKHLIGEAIDQLHKANANVIGTVLNFIDPKQHGYYGYRSYRYGSYYSDIRYGSDTDRRKNELDREGIGVPQEKSKRRKA